MLLSAKQSWNNTHTVEPHFYIPVIYIFPSFTTFFLGPLNFPNFIVYCKPFPTVWTICTWSLQKCKQGFYCIYIFLPLISLLCLGGQSHILISSTDSYLIVKTCCAVYGTLLKAKAVPLLAMEAFGRRGGIALTHSWPQH